MCIRDSAQAEQVLQDLYRPDKLNVAALGNMVAQLHVHVIGRRMDDPAWPKPVWGAVERSRYAEGQAAAEIARLAAGFEAGRKTEDRPC